MTTTKFETNHPENDAFAEMAYVAGGDQAQGTSFQSLSQSIGTGGDQSGAGELHLFNPASTTYVKHFYARSISYWHNNKAGELYTAGYIDLTYPPVMNEISFKMSSGTFDGVIQMYGIK